jgi:uncharacterized Fe-S cluster-containing protein
MATKGYKVLDIFKDLPGKNCKECGHSGCFAMATAAYLEGAPLEECHHLEPEKLAEMKAKLEETLSGGDAKKTPSHVKALEFLKEKTREMNFADMAAKANCLFHKGDPEIISLEFLGNVHEISTEDIVALQGEQPSTWVKVFLYIYITRANGNRPQDRWVAYRELPNTVSKSKSFEDCAQELSDRFTGKTDKLVEAAKRLGGTKAEFGSADLVYRFKALPKVDLLLLYWEGNEEFGARAAMLLDGGVLDYLDQEAIVFMAEAFVKRLCGESMAGLVA